MTEHSKTGGIDDVTLCLLLCLMAISMLAATVVSAIIVAAMLACSWFFGKPARVAYTGIGIAIALTAIEVLTPGLAPFAYRMLFGYREALRQDDYLLAVGTEWFRFAADPQAWALLSPLGLVAGAATLFAIEARKSSATNKVFGNESSVRPSPWAQTRLALAMAGPAIHRGAIVLGRETITGKRVTTSQEQLNHHFVVVGASGRGKTETVITLCTGAAKLGIPVFYLDGKGDPGVQQALRKIAEDSQKPFYYFDPMNPSTSCAWDVMAGLNPTAQADLIIRLRDFWSEPHYKAKASKFALLTCAVLQRARIQVDLFTFERALSVNSLLALARRSTSTHNRSADSLLKDIGDLRSIETEAVDSLKSEIGNLTDTFFGYLFDIERAKREGRTILRFAQARAESAIVCIGLPPLEYPETAVKLGAFGIGALKAVLPALDRQHKARSSTPLPLGAKQLVYVIDEWSVIAGDDVLNVINQGRSFGGSAILASQSFSDFEVDGRDRLLRQVIASTSSFIVHGLNDPQDAEYAAELFGTQDTVQFTAQTIDGSATGTASARRTKEFTIHPDQIKSIGVGEAYFMSKTKHDANKLNVRLVRIRKSTK